MTRFVRLLDLLPREKDQGLRDAVAGWRQAGGHARVFDVAPEEFKHVPGAPFAYWVSTEVRSLFGQLESFENGNRTVRTGLQTSDDFRFARAWWEVDLADTDRRSWKPMTKGGCTDPFYADIPLVLAWGPGEDALIAFRSVIRNSDCYFRSGLTWTLRAAYFRPQVLPTGSVISLRGSGVYVDSEEQALMYLGLMCSALADYLIKLMLGRSEHPQFDIGDVALLPVPASERLANSRLGELARNGWRLRQSIDSTVQTSHAFTSPAILQVTGAALTDRIRSWSDCLQKSQAALDELQSAINEAAFLAYEIGEEDRRRIVGGPEDHGLGDNYPTELGEGADEAESEGVDPVNLIENLLEWAVGAALGRFDIERATGTRSPTKHEPFEPLPKSSPGMLQAEDGLPVSEAPLGYELELPPHGILLDEPGHQWDIVARVETVLELVAGEHADDWLREAEGILGRDLRDWLRRSAFDVHLKRYSRSGRKAPLFWYLAPKSRAYGIWLYSPAATRDTFYRIQNDYIDPKLKSAERRLIELRQQAGDRPTSQQRKELAAQESLAEELRAFREQVGRITPLWRPFRDDGVVLNCAVLSSLFEHHRAWQKECAKKWDELAEGAYDWAGWAMHLWPARVVAACAGDRSVAIAHGLEEALWRENESGKWEPRADADEQVARLAAERRSPALEAALTDFLKSK